MSVKALDFAEPFFSVDYVVDEESYFVESESMVINLAEREGKDIMIKNIPVAPLRSTVVKGVMLEGVAKAIIVKDFRRTDISDVETIKKIKKTWPSLYDMSGLERHKGLPFYKSPKFKDGEGRDHIELNFCFVAQPNCPSGPHLDHDRPIDEVHALIRGRAMMRVFETNDESTKYKELNLAEGCVHDKMYDANGVYPWHDFQSVTPCVYCPIELDR